MKSILKNHMVTGWISLSNRSIKYAYLTRAITGRVSRPILFIHPQAKHCWEVYRACNRILSDSIGYTRFLTSSAPHSVLTFDIGGNKRTSTTRSLQTTNIFSTQTPSPDHIKELSASRSYIRLPRNISFIHPLSCPKANLLASSAYW